MEPIGAIAAAAGPGLGGLTAHLPWGWFTLMGVVDLLLVAVVMARRLHGRAVARIPTGAPERRPEVLVLRSGWWVPRSRVIALRQHQASYAWPLHRDYMVSRVA
jgi:hypothetical protein